MRRAALSPPLGAKHDDEHRLRAVPHSTKFNFDRKNEPLKLTSRLTSSPNSTSEGAFGFTSPFSTSSSMLSSRWILLLRFHFDQSSLGISATGMRRKTDDTLPHRSHYQMLKELAEIPPHLECVFSGSKCLDAKRLQPRHDRTG